MGERGNWLCLDVGTVRIGVAYAPAGGDLVLPIETVPVGKHGEDLRRVIAIIREKEINVVVVGLPKLMSGEEGKSARMARRYARRLAKRISPLPVRLVDERLTTAQAANQLHEHRSGTNRDVIDQAAAVLILQQALKIERIAEGLPGEAVDIQE